MMRRNLVLKPHGFNAFTPLTTIFKGLLLAAISLPLMMVSTCALTSTLENHIDIHAGQRIGMHLIKQDPKLLLPKEPFRDLMSPLSLKHGIERFAIDIESVIKGDYAADTLDIYLSWSSEKSNKVRIDVGQNPVVAEFNKRATEVPTVVKGFNLIASDSSQINFSKNKIQTVTYIWLSPEKSEDYARYESGMQAIAKRLGIMTQAIFATRNSEYHTYPNRNETPPDYVIFTEWPNANSIEEFFNSKEYKKYGSYIDSGTKAISILQFDSDSFYSSTAHGFRVTPETL